MIPAPTYQTSARRSNRPRIHVHYANTTDCKDSKKQDPTYYGPSIPRKKKKKRTVKVKEGGVVHEHEEEDDGGGGGEHDENAEDLEEEDMEVEHAVHDGIEPKPEVDVDADVDVAAENPSVLVWLLALLSA